VIDPAGPSAQVRRVMNLGHYLQVLADVPGAGTLRLFVDKEDAPAGWMDAHSVAESWQLAPMLAEAGITREQLEEVALKIGDDALGDTLSRCNLSLTASRLVMESEQSVTGISELVGAIKE